MTDRTPLKLTVGSPNKIEQFASGDTVPVSALPSSVVTLTGAQTLTNKTLTTPKISSVLDANGNTILALVPVASAANNLEIKNEITVPGPPSTSVLAVQAVGAADDVSINLIPKGGGNIRAGNLPLVTTTDSQTLTNKTLTAPTINGGTITGTINNATLTNAKVNTALYDTTGAVLLGVTATAGATNYLAISGQGVGSGTITVPINVAGDATNISVAVVPKGAGALLVGAGGGATSVAHGKVRQSDFAPVDTAAQTATALGLVGGWAPVNGSLDEALELIWFLPFFAPNRLAPKIYSLSLMSGNVSGFTQAVKANIYASAAVGSSHAILPSGAPLIATDLEFSWASESNTVKQAIIASSPGLTGGALYYFGFAIMSSTGTNPSFKCTTLTPASALAVGGRIDTFACGWGYVGSATHTYANPLPSVAVAEGNRADYGTYERPLVFAKWSA